MVGPSPEFQLLAALARPNRGASWRTAVRDLAAWVDWPRFLIMTDRHRLWGLSYQALKESGVSPPPATASALHEAALESARRSLEHAALAHALQTQFDTLGVDNLILKGAPLEQLAYGGLGRRGAFDIDMLVAPADVLVVARLLLDQDWTLGPTDPGDLKALEGWLAFSKECAFRHRPSGHVLELHWRLLDRVDDAAPPASRTVAVGPGLELRTLADAPLLTYLCAHGASHAWRRLKWLTDLAHWLASLPTDETQPWIAAGLAGPDRGAVLSGLTLAHRWLGLEGVYPAPAPPIRAFIALCESQLIADPADTSDPGAVIQAAQLLLPTDFAAWRRELRRQSISIADRRRFRLRAGWRWLYALIRGPSWLWRRLLRRL